MSSRRSTRLNRGRGGGLAEPIAMIVPDPGGDPQEYVFSGPSGGENTSTLRFPAGYDEEDESASWPVYFFLHGRNGSAADMVTTWLVQFDAAVTAGLVEDGIVVLPDYGAATWWVNSKNGTSLCRAKLNDLRARLLVATQASASNADWHLQGFSMGAWGAASWFAQDPTAWGSLVINGPANFNANIGNNWGTADAADFTAIFGDDQDYLETYSPAESWTANAAAIIAADVPIRLTLGASDAAVGPSVTQARLDITAAAIRYADDTIPSATHTPASYFSNDTTNGPMWAGATQYQFHTDPLCHAVVSARYTACYTQSGGAVTSLINRVTGVAVSSGTLPAFSSNTLNGRPCFDFNGTAHHVYGADAAWTAEVTGSDLPFTELWVVDLDVIDANQLYGGYANALLPTPHVGAGTSAAGGGRTRAQKIDDVAGASNPASSGDQSAGVHQDTWQTDSAGTTISHRRDRAAVTLASTTFDRAATTIDRVTYGARVRGPTPVVDEFCNYRLGARIFYGSSISAAWLLLAETKLRQEFII